MKAVVLSVSVNQIGKTEKEKKKPMDRLAEPIHGPAEPIQGPP
jgi:hypothetical protein